MPHDHTHDHPEQTWDEFYAGEQDGTPVWSGAPNAVLVAEVSELPPGRALDVGCGEGADAIWLAGRGWRVTAVDPSRVALDRAAAAAREAGVDVSWVHTGFEDMPPEAGAYDLVTTHYFVLPRGDDDAVITMLLDAVAPGGTLLAVHHADFAVRAVEHGLTPADYVAPADIAAHLDDAWEIEAQETRPRTHPAAQPDDPPDLVLRARRRG